MAQVTLPAGFSHIGTGAFYDCEALTQITLPPGLAHIGMAAFKGCWELTAVLVNPDPAHPREPPPVLHTIGLRQLVEDGSQLRWAPGTIALGGDVKLELPPPPVYVAASKGDLPEAARAEGGARA